MFLPFRPIKAQSCTIRMAKPTNGASGSNTSGLNARVSKDGGSFVDCTNPISYITNVTNALANQTMDFQVVLTSAEMNADVITVIAVATVSGSIASDSTTIYTTPDSVPSANVTQWNGTNVVTSDVAGEPKVTVSDKTGFSLANGQILIKKNTALNNFEFLMVDSDDSKTPKTGLTITGKVSIDGSAFVDLTNIASEVGSGVYKIDLAAADLNGSVIMFKFTAPGADPRYMLIITQT